MDERTDKRLLSDQPDNRLESIRSFWTDIAVGGLDSQWNCLLLFRLLGRRPRPQ